MQTSNPGYELRPLADSELEVGLGILLENVDWLNRKGIRQWTAEYARKFYPLAQSRKENFALTSENKIVAILSLCRDCPQHWTEEVGEEKGNFLTKVAVPTELRGAGIGRAAIEAAKELDQKRGLRSMFLEFVGDNEFLRSYYESRGFHIAARKDVTYASGVYPMVLMKTTLA